MNSILPDSINHNYTELYYDDSIAIYSLEPKTRQFIKSFFNINNDSMLSSFFQPLTYSRKTVDSSKLLEFGYYNKSKKRFITYFNRSYHKSGKYLFKDCNLSSYLKCSGTTKLNLNSPITIKSMLNVRVPENVTTNALTYRWLCTVSEYLNNDTSNIVAIKFIPGNDTNYTGGVYKNI